MTERYRLLFRGEILQGQHKAVVKKRLAEVLKTDSERVEKLFSGEPVVIKQDVDRRAAAQYQAAFKKAGARLRVVSKGSASVADTAEADGAATESGMTLAAPGSLLTDDDGSTSPPPPDTSHISVAEVGVDLVEIEEFEVGEVEIDPSWGLADVGSDLGQLEVPVEELDLDPDFSLAPPGADMDERERPAPPPAPDTSHLVVEEGDENSP